MLAASFTADPPWVLASMSVAPEQRSSEQFIRYRRFVGHALRRVGVAEADVDDLSQEVFMVLLRRVHELHDTDRLMGWLHQVVRRVAGNHRRGLQRRHERQRWWAEPAAPDDRRRARGGAERSRPRNGHERHQR